MSETVINRDWLLAGASRDTQSVTADWEPVGRALIHGVVLHEAKVVPKRKGSVTELYRDDWGDLVTQVGQVFVARLGVDGLSAWHAHADTFDRLTVIEGSATLVLYDGRQDSATFGQINEFHLLDRRPVTVIVPPRVWHGVRNSGDTTCLLVNMPNKPYRYADPDHWRVDSDTAAIPYRFAPTRGSSV